MEKSKKKLKIFISGPMTGYPNWNKEAFDRAEKRLRELGYDVFNPTWMQFTEGWSHEEIMAIDLAALEKCDAIAQLAGWQESIGAQEEFEQAKRLNKKIFMFVSEYGDLVEINYARRVIDEMGQFYKEAMDFINAGLSKLPETLNDVIALELYTKGYVDGAAAMMHEMKAEEERKDETDN